MRKFSKVQYTILGMFIMALLSSAVIPALAAVSQLRAVYNNYKIVVDGELITPKDGNGNVVEPFIVDGAMYLPVRPLAEAFGESITWDEATGTAYLGGKVDKPAMAFPVYNRSYTECSKPGDFQSYMEKGIDYVGFKGQNYSRLDDESGYIYTARVVYPLDGLATKLTGTILAPTGDGDGLNAVYSFYNDES